MDACYIIGRDSIPRNIVLKDGESLRMTLVCLPGTSAELGLDIDLTGAGTDVDIAGLYICPEAEQLDIKVNIRHSKGGGTSRQLFKGIVGGTAKAVFNGLIYVAPGAQKTKAYQESHTVLLGKGARVDASPQLEIYADDVECSHGATTGYLNEDELFYMRSRGIPEVEARRLQMISFISAVLFRLPESLQEEILGSL